jgi:hypothetical protein
VDRIEPQSAEAKAIDEAMAPWRQGDVALEARWFIHAGDPGKPLTAVAAEAVGEGPQALETEVDGLVLVAQSCDIVRSCVDRPFVEASPLVEVDEDRLQDVRKGRYPAYASIPATVPRRLVANLDRVMTVEKAIVASWRRTPGCTTDTERREFAEALARKRQRFAFPNDFNALVERLRGRLIEKHDKATAEGRALRSLREIRVLASPSWDAKTVAVMFWFIWDEDNTTFDGQDWSSFLEKWLHLVPKGGRFVSVQGQVVTLDRMTAYDYTYSDRLDLDHLSLTTKR